MTTNAVLIRSSRDPVPLPDWLRVVCFESLGPQQERPVAIRATKPGPLVRCCRDQTRTSFRRDVLDELAAYG